MLTEQTVIDKIEILENGQIQVRKSRRIFDNDIKIAEAYHRHVLEPGQGLVGEDKRVADHARLAWTPEVIESFRLKKEMLLKNGGGTK